MTTALIWGGAAALIATVCLSKASYAEETNRPLPLYEYGLGGFASYLPHYRGSDEYEFYAFPLPYFIYRGELLQADREGMRGIFLHFANFETDISVSGNPPAPDDEAREGMDDLEAIGEIGPAVRYYFYKDSEEDSFYTQLSFRAAVSCGWNGGPDLAYQGNTTELTLVYQDATSLSAYDIWFHLDTGVRFGDNGLNSYFYEVGPEDATAERPEYSATAGYAGYQLSGSIFKTLTDTLSVGFYGRWTNVEGAVFDDSPLVNATNNFTMVAMLFWQVGASDEPAPR
jgi:outer membrane scaffolding protein for murein synthesis (MipA/OmpV family)